ncbi:MAG: peptidylprolyl isomerase [Planctomycetota bacterium]
MRRDIQIACLLLCLWLPAYAASPPPEMVAEVGDEKITKDDLAAELAQITGREVLENLIQEKIIMQEIARRRVQIPDDAVEGRMKALDFRVRKRTDGDMDLPGLMEKRGASLEAQKRGVKLLLAIEQMAKKDFGMHELEPVSNFKVGKWLRSLRDKADIVGEQSGKLPKGAYAKVNGELITKEQFNGILFANSRPGDVSIALERLISRKIIDQELKSRNMTSNPSDVDSELARREAILRRNPEHKHLSLDDVLRLKGTSTHELRADPNFRMRVAAEKMIRTEITDDEARAFCEQHKALYGDGHVRASQLFIAIFDPKTRQPRGENAQADARRKIAELHDQIRDGADFAAVVKKHSDDPEEIKKKGGDLGFFPRYGQVNDPMAKAAFLLRPGELSGILEAPFGYYLVKTTDVKDPAYVDFEKAKDRVLEDLVDDRYPQWMADLRNRARVKTFYTP